MGTGSARGVVLLWCCLLLIPVLGSCISSLSRWRLCIGVRGVIRLCAVRRWLLPALPRYPIGIAATASIAPGAQAKLCGESQPDRVVGFFRGLAGKAATVIVNDFPPSTTSLP